jgi:hypothetical protein
MHTVMLRVVERKKDLRATHTLITSSDPGRGMIVSFPDLCRCMCCDGTMHRIRNAVIISSNDCLKIKSVQDRAEVSICEDKGKVLKFAHSPCLRVQKGVAHALYIISGNLIFINIC